MEAKDIKITIEPIPLERAIDEAYKAGQDYVTQGLPDLLEEARRIGIKEVVEWIENNLNAEYCAVPFPLWEEAKNTNLKSMMCMEIVRWNEFWTTFRKLFAS